jgi:hypothetical protein
MRRLTERLRGLVGKGTADEAAPPVETAPVTAPAPVAPPAPSPSPLGASATVEEAYAMLHAFPKDTEDAQRLTALRAALAATVEAKNKSLQQLLAEVLQEKARVSGILLNQDKNFELQLTKITEAIEALWEKRDKLTEHHQRVTLQGKERLESMDQLIQCLSLADETPSLAPMALLDMSAPKVRVEEPEEEGPVIVRMPMMELRPLGEEYAEEPTEPQAEPAEAAINNPRKLYSRAA